MNINIVAKQMALTPAIAEYTEKKLRTLRKYLGIEDGPALAKVELGKVSRRHQHGDHFKAEVHLSAWRKTFSASSTGSDLYAELDKVKDELVGELVSFKAQRTTKSRMGERKLKEILHHVRSKRS
ncbi:MAG: ribosomal subunit interface protein [Candidatus Vogelbacteria bacterium CG10_big_fil_rev_8_21_14_0_10_51_16]|uniref:Ribosomal subunit interface protein n=1 Tax=Candidatus Vogelbacteria bacterium CG10_big_fil_rev_8_21_14_0_10_51_16 TaxID=1975045 RepID=A0A2H0RE13_9BACT|nr:MAG: ribosomal subunit interface protein [Candidatus Vogelbacteria bacterium CG10_big_fil_rev_8_21_14_0_10_51_16]